jgi:HEAT repeat protein
MHSWEGDPHQQATPEFGSLEPGWDLPPDRSLDPTAGGWRVLFAVAGGILLALLFASGVARGAFADIARFLTLHGKPEPASPVVLSQHEIESLHHQSAQQQAELLLERDINHYHGANDEIAARAERWRGRIQLKPQLNSLITTALNSSDLRVRASGIEVDLAAMNVAKTHETAERLLAQAENGERSQRIWALWGLGLLGNRGVEQERVTQVLTDQLHDSDPEVRHWAVEGLAYLGTDDTIAPLLQTLHEDGSPRVRERAACSLAQSGMLTQQQRRSAIPALLAFADDPSLDAQTHTWIFQALRDITGQNLPDEISAWRSWYSNSGTKSSIGS